MSTTSSNTAVNNQAEDIVQHADGDEHAIDDFIRSYPLPSAASLELDHSRCLTGPVVIPQRRPGNKFRGFVEAYAPTLGQYGIQQQEFVEFIQAVNKAVQVSRWLIAVMLAAAGTGFVPNPIAMGTSAAVQIVANVLARAQTRWKTNTILDRVNQEYFQPRGLYCLLMAYTPMTIGEKEQFDADEAILNKDAAPIPATPQDRNLVERAKRNLRDPVAGKVKGEESLPANVAPLIYADGKDEGQRSSGVRNAMEKLGNYFDERAQARYAKESSGDVLSQPSIPKFKNRYLDPTHPATNGGLLGLVSGGKLTPHVEKMNQRQQASLQDYDQAIKDQQSATMDGLHQQLKLMNLSPEQEEAYIKQYEDAFQLQQQQMDQQASVFNKETGKVRKILNVLYLMIVDMPSDEQIAMACQNLEDSDFQKVGPDLGMQTAKV